MAQTINNYTTQSMHADVMDDNIQKVMMHATIQPGKLLDLRVEVLDANYATANKEAVAEAINAFCVDVFDTAADNGLPIEGGK